MARELKSRKDMDPRYQWRLEDIFATEDAYEQAYAQAEQAIEKMAGWQGRVKENPRQAILDADALALQMDHLAAYAIMRKDEESSDPARQARAMRFQTLGAKAGSAVSFLDPELLALPEETLRALMSDPDFADYSETLRLLLLQKPHTLPAEQEKLLAQAEIVTGVPRDVFSMFNDVDLPLPEVTDDSGTKLRLTHGNLGMLLRSRKRDVRKEAFEGMMGAYKGFSATVSACYAGAVKAAVFKARARRYDSARQASLAPLEIPEAVYDNLLAEVEAALPALTEYMNIRKKLLNVDELHMYDLYVPMIADFDMKMTYGEACDLVCEGLAPLGAEYVARLREGFDGGWVELVELNKYIAAPGTQEKVDKAIDSMKKGRIRVFSGNYTGVNPLNAADTIDLNKGYTECQYSSNPTFGYVLRDVITVEN